MTSKDAPLNPEPPPPTPTPTTPTTQPPTPEETTKEPTKEAVELSKSPEAGDVVDKPPGESGEGVKVKKEEEVRESRSEEWSEEEREEGLCEGTASCLAYPISHQEPLENQERGNWSNGFEFILSCLGYAIGLGNVWRFPYVVYKFGGGSFLLVYWVVFFIVAYPAFFMELALGQFTSRGPVQIFRNLIPAFEGLGWANMIVQFNSVAYYNAIFAWSIFYMFSAVFTPKWKHCDSSWNSIHCFAVADYTACVSKAPKHRYYLKKQCYVDSTEEPSNGTIPVQQFFNRVDWCTKNVYNNITEMDNKKLFNCSMAFHVTFSNFNLMKDFLGLGENCEGTIWNSTEKVGIFERDDIQLCKGWQQETSKLALGPRLINMKYKNRGKKEKEAVLKRAKLIENASNKGFSNMLKEYCETAFKESTTVECLRRMVKGDESLSSQEYMFMSIAHPDATFTDLKGFYWPLPLSLFLAWVLTGIGSWGGPKLIGKIVYFTALFPVVMIFVLFFVSLTLDGHSEGVDFYLSTRFCELGNPELWLTAAGQMFFSLSIGGGGLMTLASFNRFHNDIHRDSLIVAMGNCVFSFVAGFGIFGVIGSMAKTVGTDISELMRGSGTAVAFVTYTQATAGFAGGEFVAFLFFFMLCLLAIDTEFAMVETLLTYLYDELPVLRRKFKLPTIIIFCSFFFLLGLPHVTRGGSLFLGIIDGATYDFLLAWACVTECILIMYVYGLKNFMNDVSMMVGVEKVKWEKCSDIHIGNWLWNSPAKWFYAFGWTVGAPLGIGLILFLTIHHKATEGERIENTFEATIYWLIAAVSFPLCMLGGFALQIFYRKRTIKESFKPDKEWGPALNENRTGRYQPLEPHPLNTDYKLI